IDAEETVTEAAVREVKEETNLDVAIEGLLGVYSYVDEVKSGLVVIFQASVTGGEACAGDDAAEVATLPPEQLPPLVFASHRRAPAPWQPRQGEGRLTRPR